MNILIAEDNALYRRMLESLLTKWGFEVHVTCDGTQARQALLGENAPRLAILDWIMPGMNGLEVCKEIRKLADRPYIYLLLLTALDRKEDIIAGLNAGADDYLIKPFDAMELKARINAGKRILDLQDQLIAAREELREQATRDALTGLWNRGAILDIFGRELVRSCREQSPLGLILADLDHFKQINDTHGHLEGDKVLCEAAGRMHALVRPYDALGRYGGEEFLVVVPGSNLDATIHLAERLRAALDQAPVDLGGQKIPVTMSLGVATSAGGEPLEMNALLHAADVALYRAKSGGRNRVETCGVVNVQAEKT